MHGGGKHSRGTRKDDSANGRRARNRARRYGASTSRGRPPTRTIMLEPMIVTTTAPRIAA